MSVDLARRLARSGAVPLAVIEEALRRWVNRGEPFLAVLVERQPSVEQLLLRAAERAHVPIVSEVRVDEELLEKLPRGICDRLLAVPLGRDPRSSMVEVATADPLDPHVAREFGYQLGAPVRVMQGRVSDLISALKNIRRTPISEHTPAFGTQVVRVPQVSVPIHRSDYVRRDSQRPPAAPRGSSGGQARASGARHSVSPPPPTRTDPILDLSRQRLIEETERDDGVVQRLAQAASADEVLKHLLAGFGALVPACVVLTARSSEFVGRAGSSGLDSKLVRAVNIPADIPSVLQTACDSGYYLGVLPQTPVHWGLRQALGVSPGELLVQPIRVANKPALMVVSVLRADTERVTRRAEGLIQATSEALERILLEKKRS